MFSEQTLLDEIIKTWGEAGVHADVYRFVLKKIKDQKAEIESLHKTQKAAINALHNGFGHTALAILEEGS